MHDVLWSARRTTPFMVTSNGNDSRSYEWYWKRKHIGTLCAKRDELAQARAKYLEPCKSGARLGTPPKVSPQRLRWLVWLVVGNLFASKIVLQIAIRTPQDLDSCFVVQEIYFFLSRRTIVVAGILKRRSPCTFVELNWTYPARSKMQFKSIATKLSSHLKPHITPSHHVNYRMDPDREFLIVEFVVVHRQTSSQTHSSGRHSRRTTQIVWHK